MIMLSILFVILFFMVFGKIAAFAFKATWSIFKVALYLVFLPIVLAVMVFGGLVYIALPILAIIGLISLISGFGSYSRY